MPITISGLISAKKTLFSKNLSLPSLPNIKKVETIISYIFKVVLSIFLALTLVCHTLTLNYKVKAGLIALISLFQFSKTSVWFLKLTRYEMQGIYPNFNFNSLIFLVIVVKIAENASIFSTFWGTSEHHSLFAYKHNTQYGSSFFSLYF